MNKKGGIEIFVGAVLIILGIVVDSWVKQLYWIAIYPPPLGKQILDAMPPVLWVIGGVLTADGFWRLLTLRRSINLRFTLSLMFGAILTLGSLLYGREKPWPDYYHINYGFPFAWLTRTLSTIAGPVDYFKVDFPMLVINIIFWFAVTSFMLWSKGRIKTVKAI